MIGVQDSGSRARRRSRWWLLTLAILCEVVASLSLRGALDRSILYGVVALGYLAAFLLLGATLRRGMPLNIAYGVWAAGGVAATAVLAAVIFKEPLTPVMQLGVGVVIAGVLMIRRDPASPVAHPRET